MLDLLDVLQSVLKLVQTGEDAVQLRCCAKSLQGKHKVVVRYRQPGQMSPVCPPTALCPHGFVPPGFVPPWLCPSYVWYHRQSTRSLADQLATRDKTYATRDFALQLP